MQTAKMSEMVKGWFVGDFSPTVLATQAAEVGIKHYKAGDKDNLHYHKIATEITVVLNGRVRMNGQEYGEGSIVVIEPMESVAFEAVQNTTIVVVKVPGASNDKYLGVAKC